MDDEDFDELAAASGLKDAWPGCLCALKPREDPNSAKVYDVANMLLGPSFPFRARLADGPELGQTSHSRQMTRHSPGIVIETDLLAHPSYWEDLKVCIIYSVVCNGKDVAW